MSMNQVVAHNLARARRHRGLTQEQAAELLEPYLGYRLSKQNFSALERSASDRPTHVVREFNANEIVAFAFAFGLPLAWFFQPVSEDCELFTSERPSGVYDEAGHLIVNPRQTTRPISADELRQAAGVREATAAAAQAEIADHLADLAKQLRGEEPRDDSQG